MNFSKVLYLPSSHCQLSLSHWLIWCGPLLESQSFLPTLPSALSALWGGSLFQGHEMIYSVFSFSFYINLTWHHDQLQCSFFLHSRKEKFQVCFEKKIRYPKKKKKKKMVVWPKISSGITMKIHFLSFYLFNLFLIYVFVGVFFVLLRVQYQSAG